MAITYSELKINIAGFVANYAALPNVVTSNGRFYWVNASQGTAWLPGSLGGTYYPNGLYFSNGVTWEFQTTPYNASQATVDAGTDDNGFLTSKTFNDSQQLADINSDITQEAIDRAAADNALQIDINARQPLDADLTDIAAINSTGNGVMAADGAGWILKTYAALAALIFGQVLTGLSLVTSQIIAPTDTLLQALGYLQAQITSNVATLLTKTDSLIVYNTQAGSYTLAITDKDKIVEIDAAGANNFTVPLNATVAFEIGTQILGKQRGAGLTTIVATGGVTLNSAGGALKSSGQHAGWTLIKRGTDEWDVFGSLTT
jgi:hypothetical protein